MCVCVTGHQSVGCVLTMRWLSSNPRQQPLCNLGSIAYCYVFIFCPTRLPLPLSDVLLGGSDPSCPDTPFTNVRRVYAQDHLPT